eukprot:1172283-Amphidinium_carterae.1
MLALFVAELLYGSQDAPQQKTKEYPRPYGAKRAQGKKSSRSHQKSHRPEKSAERLKSHRPEKSACRHQEDPEEERSAPCTE